MHRHMTYYKDAVLILVLMFLTNIAWCATKEETPKPEALISRARMQEEIWTEGTPSMKMQAELQVYDAEGNLGHGITHSIGSRLLDGEK